MHSASRLHFCRVSSFAPWSRSLRLNTAEITVSFHSFFCFCTQTTDKVLSLKLSNCGPWTLHVNQQVFPSSSTVQNQYFILECHLENIHDIQVTDNSSAATMIRFELNWLTANHTETLSQHHEIYRAWSQFGIIFSGWSTDFSFLGKKGKLMHIYKWLDLILTHSLAVLAQKTHKWSRGRTRARHIRWKFAPQDLNADLTLC